jgi:sugar fermentation stimulation protein A
MDDCGLYIAVFELSDAQNIRIGKLGSFQFQAGTYFYVGSAQRNLTARIERHARQSKPLRWHIDYLSVHAPMLGAVLIPGPRQQECHIANELRGLYDSTIPHFGASDCRCPGHLFYTRDF